MMNVRRGQAALEFLMTYGWAILVVLAAIGALAYFGVLNPTNLLPDTCVPSSGFACPGKPYISGDTIAFSVINGLGQDITFDAAEISAGGTLSGCTAYVCAMGDLNCVDPTYNLQNGQGMTVRLTGCTIGSSQLIKTNVHLNYTNPQSLLPESATFSISGKIKTS